LAESGGINRDLPLYNYLIWNLVGLMWIFRIKADIGDLRCLRDKLGLNICSTNKYGANTQFGTGFISNRK